MNVKLVSRYIGIALCFNAMFMFLSAVVSMLNGFDASFFSLMISGLVTLIVGTFPLIFVRKSESINLREGFAITILSWFLCCVFGMFPYLLWGGEFTLANAWFESVSGFTTTGSTILTDIESLPKGLIFWRSSTHFVGGIGVVVFMLLVLPSMSTFRMRMSKMEISYLSKENYKFKTNETIRVISIVYIGITLLAFISLMIAGMSAFDAINHAFSIVATGGFSSRNLSFAYFDSFPIELVCIICLLLSGLHFGLLYSSIVTRTPKIFRSPIIKFFLIVTLLSSLAIGVNLKVTGEVSDWLEAMRMAFFQVVSVGTTTGFATADTSHWPTFSVIVLLLVSTMGACSGSTTGGLKSDRIWIFFQSVKNQIQKQLHPNAVIPIKVGNHTLDADLPSAVTLFIAFYMFIVVIMALLLSALGLDFLDSISASLASMSNTGPGFGTCGSLGNFNHFPVIGKIILTIEMFMGRLEIYTLLMVFVIFRRR